MKKKSVYKLVFAAMFLALALVLPFLTGQIKMIGKALCPMHLPVILCGFFVGPVEALIVGFVAPILRFLLFGMPVIFPSGIGMSFELAAYGVAAGLLYKKLPKKKLYVYVSLVGAMIIGRVVWGLVRMLFSLLFGVEFGWQAFVAGALLDAIPGIIVQISLIPILVIALKKVDKNY